MYKCKAYMNGQFIDSDEVVEVISPETNKVVGTVPALTKNQIKEMFTIAKNSIKLWSNTSKEERCKIINNYADLLLEHKEEIAEIMVHEIAKGFNSGVGEVKTAANYIKNAVKWYLSEKPKVLTEKDHGVKGKIVHVKYKPYGVIMAISPFNYPVNLAVTKFIPALITGNTVVFKAATNGCIVGAKLTELFHKAGIPKGVFNNATGRGREIGDELVQNENVSGISFTGSSFVGKRIASLVSKIPVVLELGGKGPAIVREDANLELAADKIMAGAFSYSGQRCTAIKRVIAHKNIVEALTAKLVEKTKNLSIGLASDNSTITAVVNEKSKNFIKQLVSDAKAKGANLNGFEFKSDGNLVYPMIISSVKKEMSIYYDEQFGPTLPIISYTNDDEAIKIANDSVYGLQASIFTEDISMAHKMAVHIETGSVNFNSFPQSGPIQLPFLGVKDSGFMTQGLTYSISNMRHEFNVVENN